MTAEEEEEEGEEREGARHLVWVQREEQQPDEKQ